MARLRLQAAVVRSLLDELDEAVPSLSAPPDPGLVEQLGDELERLSREVHQLASVMAQPRPGLAAARWDDAPQEDLLPRRMTLVAL